MELRVFDPEHWLDAPDEPPRLAGGRCRSCGVVFFPQFAICPACLGEQPMERIGLSRRGHLYVYTVVFASSPTFKAPYAIGYVDLPEGPRVFGQVDGWEGGELALDQPMEIYRGRIGMDREVCVLGIRFRPTVERDGEEG